MMRLNDEIKRFRVRMHRFEHIHTWSASLLDCYAIIDHSVSKAIRESEKQLACHEGCAICCYQPIPLSILECLGIKYYVQNMLDKKIREILLRKTKENNQLCLFNIEGSCVIYPLRPIACRRYLVCSHPCRIGEDPTVTRKDDMLIPSRVSLYQAIAMTLPFYGLQNKNHDQENIIKFYMKKNVILSSVYHNIVT